MKRLFVIEGIDGCGKGLLIKNLKEIMGVDAVYLREPSDSVYGRKLIDSFSRGRLSREEEYSLFLKDRKVDVEENIIPSLEMGKIVILDRYYHSTIAYQGALGMDIEKIVEDNRKIAPVPEATFILDIPVEVSSKRIGYRRNSFENPEYLEEVRQIYLILPKLLDEKIYILDGTKSPLEIRNQVSRFIQGRHNLQ